MNSIMECAGSAVAENVITRSSTREGPVIIVDDDPNDAVRTEGVIDELQPKCQVRILASGEDLVSYLQGGGLYADRSRYPYPGLVLLDLQMPKMNGLDVLQWLLGHPEHADLPVVVLSGWYELSREVTRACQLGALSFLPKPVQPHDVQGVLAVLNISIERLA